jgi:hypothetical protein
MTDYGHIAARLFHMDERTWERHASPWSVWTRVWLNRKTIPIPGHHVRMAHLLTAASALGFAVALVGAFLNDWLATVSGGLMAWFAKMWFCDRMVWLYDEMKNTHPPYAEWLRVGQKEVR